MSQLFTDDEIIAETPKQKRIMLIMRWTIKILVTVLTSITTVLGVTNCTLPEPCVPLLS